VFSRQILEISYSILRYSSYGCVIRISFVIIDYKDVLNIKKNIIENAFIKLYRFSICIIYLIVICIYRLSVCMKMLFLCVIVLTIVELIVFYFCIYE